MPSWQLIRSTTLVEKREPLASLHILYPFVVITMTLEWDRVGKSGTAINTS